MIYIKRKTQTKQKILRYKLDEAVRFIVELEQYTGRNGTVHIVGAEDELELKEFLSYFVPELFIKEELDTPFGSYRVNLDIPKKSRMLISYATKKTIQKFADKISNQLGIRQDNIYYGANFFSMTFESENMLFDFICSYKLEVMNSYVRSKNNEFKYNTEETKKLEQTINRIFVKQRYYYKHKGERK